MFALLSLLACKPAVVPVKPEVEPMQVQPGVTCFVASAGGQIVGFSCIGAPQPGPLPPPVAAEAASTATATAAAEAPKAEEKKAE